MSATSAMDRVKFNDSSMHNSLSSSESMKHHDHCCGIHGAAIERKGINSNVYLTLTSKLSFDFLLLLADEFEGYDDYLSLQNGDCLSFGVGGIEGDDGYYTLEFGNDLSAMINFAKRHGLIIDTSKILATLEGKQKELDDLEKFYKLFTSNK